MERGSSSSRDIASKHADINKFNQPNRQVSPMNMIVSPKIAPKKGVE